MSISKLAIKRPVTVIMMIMVAVVLGTVSYTGMGLDLLPDISTSTISVITTYQGAGPQEVESLITRPIEEVMGTLSNFKGISSTSSNGSSSVSIEFVQGTDLDMASLDIREKIDMVKSSLPDDAATPRIFKFSTDMMPLSLMAVSSVSMDENTLKSFVDDKVKNRLERLNGVAAVTVYGGLERQIRIEVIPEKMAGYGLSVAQITQALRAENVNMPAGNVTEGSMQLSIRVVGEFSDISEIEDMAINTAIGTIQLKDVAEIVDDSKDRTAYISLDGSNALYYQISKQSGFNTVTVSDRVVAEMKKIKNQYPEVNFVTVFEQADSIKSSINSVINNALSGALLAIIILFLFLKNVRTTFVIGLSIPISIITTFVFMYFSGLSLNMMSLAGLALGVGMLVDNSIVVLESIFKYGEEGYEKAEAAWRGTGEVAMAITASTLTTIAVFIPIAFIRDNMAISLFKDLALTITFSLLASLLVALTVVPMMASKILRVDDKEAGAVIIKTKNPFIMAANFVEICFVKITDAYTKALCWSLRHRKTVLISSFTLLVVSVIAAFSICGMEFFPSADSELIRISSTLPKGTVLDESAKVADVLTAIFQDIPETKFCFQAVGGENNSESNSVMVLASIGTKDSRKRSSDEIMEYIRSRTKDIAGADTSVGAMMGGMGSLGGGSPIAIKITGDDLEQLEEISDRILEEVGSIEGVRELRSSLSDAASEANVRIDRAKLSSYGLSASTVASAVQTAIMGQTATKFKVEGEEVDVVVRFEDVSRQKLDDLDLITIISPAGQKIPLYEVADIEIEQAPTSITRSEQVRIITVSGDVVGRNMSSVFTDIQAKINSMSMPSGYNVTLGGDNENINEAVQALGLMIIMAILLVYMVMASQFESLLHPFTILFTIPLAFTGTCIALIIAHKPFSVVALMGIVMLVGIVVNNAIVLVDYINILRERGMDRDDAIIQAGPVRLRPILMTTLTTVLGLVPLSLGLGSGAEQQAPLGIAVVGGLSYATVLTLIVIPIMYTLFDGLSNRIKRLFGRKKKAVVNAES